jgi:hypothetical protein
MYMKKIKYYILLLLVATIALTSCDSLDLSPEDYYGSNNFWNNEAQVKGLLSGPFSVAERSFNTMADGRSAWGASEERNIFAGHEFGLFKPV